MIKVFTTNKDGKIELTKDELKKLLDEAYWEGYRSNSFVWQSPNYIWTPYQITCQDSTISVDSIKGGTITVNTTVSAKGATP